jgi:hypothetical protein
VVGTKGNSYIPIPYSASGCGIRSRIILVCGNQFI